MPQHVTHRLTYDAPAARVYAMLTNPGFREEVCARMNVESAQATVTPVGEGVEVVIEQVQIARGLPSLVTKLLGDTIEIIQRERWRTPERADIEVLITGKPGAMTGSATLEEALGKTVETVELDISVPVPLVSGKLERFVADMLVRALEAENAVGREFLRR